MALKQKTTVFLTGASGLLGRAIHEKFESEGWDVYGIALTRVQNNLHKLDLTCKSDVTKAIEELQPDLVIHAAAQRFPDKVDANPEAARELNVDATANIAEAAAKTNIPVLYISTDYVFDGFGNKPYTVNDKPCPINLYGKTKLEGELKTLQYPGNIVLRVPVLYGPVKFLKESAVTYLLEPLLNQQTKAQVSNVERRCPSHVDDIALICLQLTSARLKDDSLNGIFQWCGSQKMTKYQMIQKMAELLKIPSEHITPDLKSESNTKRPFDTELDRTRLELLGFGQHIDFEKGIVDVLSPWVERKQDLSLKKM